MAAAAAAETSVDYSIGQVVAVAPRTGPGQNELGGIARIVAIRQQPYVVDVQYVLDGRMEYSVAARAYLQPHSFTKGPRRVLGRCRRCGSLRSDCGGCDDRLGRRRAVAAAAVPEPLLLQATTTAPPSLWTSSSSSEESDSSAALQAVRRSQRRAFARYKRRQAKALALLLHKNHGAEPQRATTTTHEDGGMLAVVTAAQTQTMDDHDASSDDSESADSATRRMELSKRNAASTVNRSAQHRPGVPSPASITGEEPFVVEYAAAAATTTVDHSDDDPRACYFIQPEGNAEQLPADVVDATAHLPQSELVPFLEATMNRIQTQVDMYTQRLQDMQENDEREQMDDRPQPHRYEHLHTTMVHALVRNGIDQCSRAWRRCPEDSVLELRFDRLSRAVETVLRQALRAAREEEDAISSSAMESSDDGWVDPSGESPPQRMVPQSPLDTRMEQEGDNALDPHPFATRKRKSGSNAIDRRKRTRRKRKPAKRSKKKSGVWASTRQKLTTTNQDEAPEADTSSSDDSLALRNSTPQRNRTRETRSKRRRKPQTTAQRELADSDTTALHRFLEDVRPTNRNRPVETSMVHRMEQWIERNAPERPRTQKRQSHRGDTMFFSNTQQRNSRATRDDGDKSNDLTFADILSQSLGKPDLRSSAVVRTDAEKEHNNGGSTEWGTTARALSLLLEGENDTLVETTLRSRDPVITEEEPAQLLDSLRLRLMRDGSKTLQDHISSNDLAGLRAFVSILATMLRLLDEEGTNHHLSSSGGIVRSLFARDSRTSLLDCIILQFVDAVMSLMHPRAWGLSLSTASTKLKILEPLRDALGLHVLLTERVSRCILHELGVQEWHCVRGGERAYISAVDPASWKALLERGQQIKRPPLKSRFAEFTGFLPRCEVDALWKLLAYSSCCNQQPRGTNESCRWQLLSQLFSKGSLSNESDSKLAPSQGQINAGQSDVSKLTELIRSGSLGELPRRDKFLFDLIHRAILLHTRSVKFDATKPVRPGIEFNGTKDEKEVIQLLVAGDVQRLLQPHHELVTPEFAVAQRRWLGQPLYFPPSKTIHVCLRLAVEWQAKLPSENVKRMRLFDRSVKTLATNLARTSEKATGNSRQNVDANDPFLGAFGQNERTPTTEIPASQDRSALSQLEGPAFISVFCCAPIAFQADASLKDYVKYVWEIVSDTAMKEHHSWLHGDLDSTAMPVTRCLSAYRLELASKVMTCLFLVATGQLDVQLCRSSTEIEAERDPMCYVLSCVVTCFDCACNIPGEVKSTSIIQCHLATVASVILKSLSPDAHHSTRWNLIANWFATKGWNLLLKSNTLDRSFRRTVANEVCGVEEDLSLQCLLVTITKAASLFSRCNSPEESSAEQDYSKPTVPPTASIYELLEAALQNSRPSARHSLSALNTYLSTQGMCILSKRFSLVCRCLASLADPALHQNSIKAWLSGVRFARRCDQDENYRRKTGLALMRSLVLRQQSERNLLKVFDGAREEFLTCVVIEILDIALLQKIPSCNLGRMTASATSSVAEQKAFEKLVSFGRGESRPAIQAREAKRFIESMGGVFTELGETIVGGALISYGKGNNTANGMPLSLERECLEIVRLVINIMDATAESQQLRYEQLVKIILWTSCSNMMEILVSDDVQARANEDVDPGACRRAQHFEFFSCYCEIFVSVLAYAFFRAKNDLSCDFVGVLSTTAERLLSPVLNRHESSLQSCLAPVLSSIEEIDVRRHIPSAGAREWEFTSIFRECITRRYVFFLHGTLCISQLSKGSFTRALFGSIAYETKVSALSTTRRSPSCILDSSSPIHPHLERVFKDCYNARSFSLQMKRRTVGLRYTLLETLVPRLGIQRSAQIVTTIRAVLDVCKHEVDERLLPPRLPCSVIRGMWIAAQFGLSGHKTVQNDLLAECFLCAHSLMALPASYLSADSQGTVIDFIRTSGRQEDQYLFAAVKFFCSFGQEIIDGPSFPELRSFVRDMRNPRKQEVSWPLFTSYRDETATHCVNELEQQLFGKGVTIVNVYATPSKPEFIEPLALTAKPKKKLLAAAAKLVSLLVSDLP